MQVVHFEHGLPGVGVGFVNGQDHGPSDHHLGQRFLGGFGRRRGAHHLPAAHDADGVGHGEHFAQFVRDEDDGFSLLDQRAHDDKKLVGFLGGEHSGGFIQNQDVGVAVKGFNDFNPLLRTNG